VYIFNFSYFFMSCRRSQ